MMKRRTRLSANDSNSRRSQRYNFVTPSHHRSGAALVEFAVVLPVILVLIIGAVDVGRAIGVYHTLTEAARAGSRLYSAKKDVTEQQVRDIVETVMVNADLAGYTLEFDPAPAVEVTYLTPLTVTISIPFEQVSLFRTSWFLSGRTLKALCIMPADTEETPGGGA